MKVTRIPFHRQKGTTIIKIFYSNRTLESLIDNPEKAQELLHLSSKQGTEVIVVKIKEKYMVCALYNPGQGYDGTDYLFSHRWPDLNELMRELFLILI